MTGRRLWGHRPHLSVPVVTLGAAGVRALPWCSGPPRAPTCPVEGPEGSSVGPAEWLHARGRGGRGGVTGRGQRHVLWPQSARAGGGAERTLGPHPSLRHLCGTAGWGWGVSPGLRAGWSEVLGGTLLLHAGTSGRPGPAQDRGLGTARPGVPRPSCQGPGLWEGPRPFPRLLLARVPAWKCLEGGFRWDVMFAPASWAAPALGGTLEAAGRGLCSLQNSVLRSRDTQGVALSPGSP